MQIGRLPIRGSYLGVIREFREHGPHKLKKTPKEPQRSHKKSDLGYRIAERRAKVQAGESGRMRRRKHWYLVYTTESDVVTAALVRRLRDSFTQRVLFISVKHRSKVHVYLEFGKMKAFMMSEFWYDDLKPRLLSRIKSNALCCVISGMRSASDFFSEPEMNPAQLRTMRKHHRATGMGGGKKQVHPKAEKEIIMAPKVEDQ